MRYSFIFTVATGLFACKEDCDPGNLDSSEKGWIMYDSNERVIFFSSSVQQYDTAYASTPEFEFTAGGYSQGQDDCGPHGSEAGSQSLTFPSGNQTMGLSVTHDYNRIGTSAWLNYLEIPETTSGTLVINGHSYNDVRVLQYDSSQCVDQYVWRYYVNQDYGVLKFERKNGLTWELSR